MEEVKLMIIKKFNPKAFQSITFKNINTIKEFLIEIEKKFVKNEKYKIDTFFVTWTNIYIYIYIYILFLFQFLFLQIIYINVYNYRYNKIMNKINI